MEHDLTPEEVRVVAAFEARMKERFASPGFVESIYNAGGADGVGPRVLVLEELRRCAVVAGYQAELVGTVIIVRRA